MRQIELDIEKNRKCLNYSKRIYIKRILWTFGKFFFRNSPRIAFGYRNTLLRLFGAKIGKQVHIYSSTVIWFPWNLEIGDWSAIGEDTLIYNLGRVVIGKKATISHRTHICAGHTIIQIQHYRYFVLKFILVIKHGFVPMHLLAPIPILVRELLLVQELF